MRRFKIVYTDIANNDLTAIGDRIREAAGDRVAERFIESVIARVNALQTTPRLHRVRRKLGPGIRATCFRKYLVFYGVDADVVSIIRVLHGARKITERFFREG